LDLNIQKLASKLQNVPEFGVKNINKHVLTLEHSTSQKHNEIIIFKSGRIIVKGTKSVNNAKSIAARLISF
jgi:TATA-box binding protein (TBP) (component of TFIID and TFIIIB)